MIICQEAAVILLFNPNSIGWKVKQQKNQKRKDGNGKCLFKTSSEQRQYREFFRLTGEQIHLKDCDNQHLFSLY